MKYEKIKVISINSKKTTSLSCVEYSPLKKRGELVHSFIV